MFGKLKNLVKDFIVGTEENDREDTEDYDGSSGSEDGYEGSGGSTGIIDQQGESDFTESEDEGESEDDEDEEIVGKTEGDDTEADNMEITPKPNIGIELATKELKEEFLRTKTTEALRPGASKTHDEKLELKGDHSGPATQIIPPDKSESKTGASGGMDWLEKQRPHEPNVSSRPGPKEEHHDHHGSAASNDYGNYYPESLSASTALESDISDIIEKKGIFKEVPSLYRVVKVVSDQQDTLMIEKALIEGEQLWHICKDAGYENQCAMDASSIDFSVLNNCQLEFTGVFGSKVAVIEFLSHYKNSKSVVTALSNTLTGDNQTESSLPAGVYLWINRSAEYPSEDQVPSEVSSKALTKAGGVVFVWAGQFNIFENSSKSSMVTTLVRYLMDLSSCDIVLAMTEEEFSDFDPKNVSEFQKIMSEVRGVTIKKTTKQDNFEIYESSLRLGHHVKYLDNRDASVSFSRGNRQISVVVTRKKDAVTKRETKTEQLDEKKLLAFFKKKYRVIFPPRFDVADIQYKIARCLPVDCKLNKIIIATEKLAQEFDNSLQESLRKLEDDSTKKVYERISSTKDDLSLALQCIDRELSWKSAKFKGNVEMKKVVDGIRRACLCKKCRKVLKDPVKIKCGCTFCQKCVKTLVKTCDADALSCPECNRKFKKDAVWVVDEAAADIVKQYKDSQTKYRKTCSKEFIKKKFAKELKKYSELKKKKLESFKYVLRAHFRAFQQLVPKKFSTEVKFKTAVEIKSGGKSRKMMLAGLKSLLKKNTKYKITPKRMSNNPPENEWIDAIRKAKTRLKLDDCDTEDARKKCVDELVKQTERDVKAEYRIDEKKNNIVGEHKKKKDDLKEEQRKALWEEFRKMYQENENKREVWVRSFKDFRRTSHGFGFVYNSFRSYCLTFDIDVTTEGAYENTIYRYFPKNMTAVVSGLSEEGDKCPKMEGKFGQVKKWNSPPSGDETIFLYELENQANLRLVHQSQQDRGNRQKSFTYVFLDRPSKKNLGNTSFHTALDHLAGKPILVRFEESKGLLIVYRRYKIDRSYHDELGIFVVDVDMHRLTYNSMYDLGRNFNQPENEDVPILSDFFIVPNKNEIVMLKHDGTFWKLDIQSKVVESCPNRRKIDLKRNRNVQLFCTPDPLMIVIYWDSEEKVWVLEGCLLSNRRYDDGKVINMFHPFKHREFKEFSEESTFSMLMQSPIHLLMVLDEKTRNISTLRLSIQVFESKIQQRIQFNNDGCDAMPKSNCLLNYIYYAIFKFPTRNGVVSHLDRPEKNIHLCISREANVSKKTQREVASYYNDICAEISKTAKNLKADLSYEFSSRKGVKLTKDFVKETMSTMIEDDESDDKLGWRLLGNWLQNLICFIPIQIARHYFGDFKPLCNGLPIGFDDIVDTLEEKHLSITDYAREIRFGLLETVFRANADKQVYVISCVGTQSSGKSTLLNNLAGCYFNIGAGRCTDGIWMSVAVTSESVYVLLDFEGLGSFEKTCEQDMLSSLFGAAVSNIFIVRTTMHFDNFTKNTLGLWAKGARHLKFKKSKMLFNGKIVLNPRDVDAVDSLDVITEFFSKFEKTLNLYEGSIHEDEEDGNKVDKILEMFVEWMIKPTQKNNTIGYYKTLFKFLDESDVLGKPNFKGSCEFMEKSKIFLAQLAMKDFSSIDEVYVKTIIEDVLNLKNDVIYGGVTSSYPISNICFGSIESWKQTSKHLKEAFRSASNLKDDAKFTFVVECEAKEIEILKAHSGEIKLQLKFEENRVSISFDNLCDSGFVLGPVVTSRNCYLVDKESFWKNIIKVQLEFFKRKFPLRKETALVWFNLFGSFLTALARRRIERACAWARNRLEKLENREAKNILEQFELEANGLVKKLQLCGTKCNTCFLRCCLQVGHDTKKHDCLPDTKGDHKCQEFCHYCQLEKGNEVPCKLLAGHIGFCHCAGETHECGKLCSLAKFFGCSKHCYLKAKHDGECMCKTEKGRHLCGQPCTLNGCPERCICVYDEKHEKHACHRNKCPWVCELCSEECASNNHFHAMDCPDEHHLCRNAHRCPNVCQHPGTCEVKTIAVRRPMKGEFSTHDGKVVSFEEFSLQNGEKKNCYIKIPPGEKKHEGPHTCIPPEIEGMKDDDECHSCNVKCCQCGYFCIHPFKHEGMHECTHGNMRNARFLVEEGKDSDEMLVKIFQDDNSSTSNPNSAEESKEESQTPPKSNFQLHKIGHGSSGKFTTCTLGCMAKEGNGRGHIHLVRCKYQSKEECEQKNKLDEKHLRHQTCVYDKDVMYDEVKCEYFWREILKFKSSFSREETKEFDLCNCKCGLTQIHEEEGKKKETEGEGKQKDDTDGTPKIPFCLLPLWHKPVGTGEKPEGYEGEGYVSTDGHFFPCSHGLKGGFGACHSYFIIDNSGSMERGDVKPSAYDWITGNHSLDNRLGLVLEAVANYVIERENKCQNDLFSLITFNGRASLVCSGEPVSYVTVKNGCGNLRAIGGTKFMAGFKKAFSEFEKRRTIDTLFTSVFILFTDGEDLGSQSDCKQFLREMCGKYEGIRIHTIGFAARGLGSESYLKDIAEIGGGSYHLPGDAVEVVGSFSAIAQNPTKSAFGV